MSWDLTDAQRQLQQEAREFSRDVVLPIANELDPKREDIPWTLIDQMAERGYFGILIDKEYGGLGLGNLEYLLVTEELARAWMSVSSVIARSNGTGTKVSRPRVACGPAPPPGAGQAISAGAFSEPEAGSDHRQRLLSSGARRRHYVVTGIEEVVWMGEGFGLHPPACANQRSDRRGGLDMFLIEKERGSFPDGMTGQPIPKIGYHGITSWRLDIKNLIVPVTHRLVTDEGESSQGFPAVREVS